MNLLRRYLVLSCFMAASFGLSGCSKDTAPQSVAKSEAVAHAENEAAGGHKHGEWWCDEHGVPEAECALCDSKVAAEFQKKGDWCKEHDRPDSQCFICHPEKLEEFAARYEAKYGKQPPKPELN